jgi:hypothetical protein
MDDLFDTTARYTCALYEPILGNLHGIQEVLQQDLTRVDRFLNLGRREQFSGR